MIAAISYAVVVRTARTMGVASSAKANLSEDALLSSIAVAIGEPARTRMLLNLMDGRARTSTELAALAGVTPSTASAHLKRLTGNRLIRVARQGRHRYYSLGGTEVAAVLEGLSRVAGTSVRAFVPSTPSALRRARSCYDHMAGVLAVTLHDHFLREGWLIPRAAHDASAYELSVSGEQKLRALRIDVDVLRSRRRRFAYGCLDWSERKPHIAGALGAALLEKMTAQKWVVRETDGRALRLTSLGGREMHRQFGIRL